MTDEERERWYAVAPRRAEYRPGMYTGRVQRDGNPAHTRSCHLVSGRLGYPREGAHHTVEAARSCATETAVRMNREGAL